MKTLRIRSIAFICAFSLLVVAEVTSAATIGFNGQLSFVEVDNGTGVYSGVPLGMGFFGEIDDVTFNGSITDGTTLTKFGCCIAAGGMEITNDMVLTSGDADFLNTILGSTQYSAGDLIDGVNIEGDVATSSGGRIEIGLSYLLDPSSFSNTDPSNYPFNPVNVEAALFFILEEDLNGIDIYSAGGLISSVPLPATMWLFGSGILGFLGLLRRRTGIPASNT